MSHKGAMESPHIRITESYPLELHYIKAQLLQKQYRRCISTCREVLQAEDAKLAANPLQRSFVQFYLALAHDELARAMHNFSQAKIPAFNQAEQFYHEALAALPTTEQCAEFVAATTESDDDHQVQTLREASSNSLISNSTLSHSRPFSPNTHIRNNSLPTRSPPVTSPGGRTSSDLDDLESHDSFGQIMTPNRIPKLERDYSSISLLQQPQRQTSQGLMRPIRMGDPAQAYHVPPELPYSGTYHQSRLPRLDTGLNGSPVRKQLRSPSEQVSPVDSPVSPLGSEGVVSDAASTISPVSPETPLVDVDWGTGTGPNKPQRSMQPLNEHLEGMRAQLGTHIQLLHQQKRQTLSIQAERAFARAAPSKNGQMAAMIDAAGKKDVRMQQSHSFWSFTPEDVKAVEKRRRIEAGRERGWIRKRFEPGRYTELAEAALAEL